MPIAGFGDFEFLRLLGPNDYHFDFTSADFKTAWITHKFTVGDSLRPVDAGVYTFHGRIAGQNYFGYASLTPERPLPVFDDGTFQAEDLGNGKVRLSWGDGDYTGPLYYRVFVKDVITGSTWDSGPERFNARHLDVPWDTINAIGPNPKSWRVEALDSTSRSSSRNRALSAYTPMGDPAVNPITLEANVTNYSRGNDPVASRFWGQALVGDVTVSGFQCLRAGAI